MIPNYCVSSCPPGMFVFERSCVLQCPTNFAPNASSVCKSSLPYISFVKSEEILLGNTYKFKLINRAYNIFKTIPFPQNS